MSLANDDELGSLHMAGGKTEKDDITKQALKVLWSNEPSKIIQSTEFEKQDLVWVTALELVNHFVIKPFCFDRKKRDNFQEIINRIYQSRVSLDRKGRTELFESMKAEQNIFSMFDNMKREQLR